jgi:hypothetical protein
MMHTEGFPAGAVQMESEEEAFVLALSEVTAHVPQIAALLRSEAWQLSTVSFLEAYSDVFVDGAPAAGQPSRAAVHAAFQRLIDQLVAEELMSEGPAAPPLGTFALFCELVGPAERFGGSVLHGYVEPDVVQQVALVLALEDEASFGALMGAYAEALGPGATDPALIADGRDAFGFARLFDSADANGMPDGLPHPSPSGSTDGAPEHPTTVFPGIPEATAPDVPFEASATFAQVCAEDSGAVVSTVGEREQLTVHRVPCALTDALAHARQRRRAWEEHVRPPGGAAHSVA